MKILAPVDSPQEAKLLASLGALELYGGYLTDAWERRFALDASPNRRTFPEAQIRGREQLEATVRAAHEGGARFFLTMNAPFFAAGQREAVLAMTEEALGAGADALIVADPGLILEARARWPAVPVHLSSLGEAGNSAAAAFYRDLGVARITLPRHLAVSEIRNIVELTPGVAFDVFVLYGQCPNAEGACTFSHDHPKRIWPCVQRYKMQPAAGITQQAVAPAVRGQGLWGGCNRTDACGFCAIPELGELGVEAVKVVGRGSPTTRKVWAVRTLRSLFDTLEKGAVTPDGFRRQARRTCQERFGRACEPRLCYFPEHLPDGGA